MRSTKMATSLLRLGRLGSLKCLRQDGWGSLRTPLTAAFCTKAEAPKKPAKKASTLEASDERAALLASKTTVAFPTRLSTLGFLSQGVALGVFEQSRDPVTNAEAAGAACAESTPSAETSIEESVTIADAKQAESVTDDFAKAKTESCDVAAHHLKSTPAAETATEKDATSTSSADVEAPNSEVTPKDDDSTSSSSSSSDSDSGSDSDDEKPDKTEMDKFVVQAEDKAGQEENPSAVSEEPASDVKTGAVPEGATKGAPQVTKAVSEPTSKKVLAPRAASAPSKDLADPAPVLCTAESVKAQAEIIPEKDTGVEMKSSEASDAIPETVTEGAPNVTSQPTPEVVHDSATKVASESEVEIKAAPETTKAAPETTKAAPETTKAAAASEELVDTAPVITDAEEVRAEPEVAAAPEEAAAAPAPAPAPEPFDNTTYKNLQHHNYNIYTFVDKDVEMAEYRLPQPSTGRPSPRH